MGQGATHQPVGKTESRKPKQIQNPKQESFLKVRQFRHNVIFCCGIGSIISVAHGWVRRALAPAAWAASKCKDSYLSAQYRRLAARWGKYRALIAVGHTILRVIYHLLKYDVEYEDLGANFYENQ